MPRGRSTQAARRSMGPSKPIKTKQAAQAPAASRKRKATSQSDDELSNVEHPSHAKVAGDLFVIGDGDCGQFGLGEDVVEAPRPLLTTIGGQQVIQVAAGGMHSVALTAEHQVWSSGVNDECALGRHTAGEQWQGQPGAEEDSYTWAQVDVPTTHGAVVQIAAGDSHTVALTAQGAIYGWGTYRDATGVYGFAPGIKFGLRPALVWAPTKSADQAVKVASGTDHSIMLTRGGDMYTWGTGRQGQLGRIGVRLLERDDKAVLLKPHRVKRTKRVRGMSTHTPLVDVACGSYASYAVDEAGHVWAWGLNQYGQLGLPDLEPMMTPAVATSLQGHHVTQLRGGQHHTLALTQEGKLLSFGRPTYGRLGRQDVSTGSDDAVAGAKPVGNLDGVDVTGMAAGIMVSGCFSSSGEAFLWGANTNSQLGKGDDDSDETVPLRLKETKRFKDRKVVGMEVGGQHVLLLSVLKDGAAAAAGPHHTAKPTTAAAPSSHAEESTHAPPEPAPADVAVA